MFVNICIYLYQKQQQNWPKKNKMDFLALYDVVECLGRPPGPWTPDIFVGEGSRKKEVNRTSEGTFFAASLNSAYEIYLVICNAKVYNVHFDDF